MLLISQVWADSGPPWDYWQYVVRQVLGQFDGMMLGHFEAIGSISLNTMLGPFQPNMGQLEAIGSAASGEIWCHHKVS